MRHYSRYLVCVLLLLLSGAFSTAFRSDELLQDDEEFGLEGGRSADPDFPNPILQPPRRRADPEPSSSSSSSDSKAIQFNLEHAFGDSGFSPAGIFTARLKTWSHGGQTLTKLRFARNPLTETEREAFERLLKEDDYYTIRVPSNVWNPGQDHVISSVRARCLARENLDEHFVIHMDGVNILAVNYGSAGACPFPRLLRLPSKWSFKSHTVLKNSEQAPRTPVFAEELLVAENVDGGGEGITPPEKSFWAKYWMYMIPLGLIVMNAVTQAMNVPEEPSAGAAPQAQQAALPQAPNAAVRRR